MPATTENEAKATPTDDSLNQSSFEATSRRLTGRNLANAARDAKDAIGSIIVPDDVDRQRDLAKSKLFSQAAGDPQASAKAKYHVDTATVMFPDMVQKILLTCPLIKSIPERNLQGGPQAAKLQITLETELSDSVRDEINKAFEQMNFRDSNKVGQQLVQIPKSQNSKFSFDLPPNITAEQAARVLSVFEEILEPRDLGQVPEGTADNNRNTLQSIKDIKLAFKSEGSDLDLKLRKLNSACAARHKEAAERPGSNLDQKQKVGASAEGVFLTFKEEYKREGISKIVNAGLDAGLDGEIIIVNAVHCGTTQNHFKPKRFARLNCLCEDNFMGNMDMEGGGWNQENVVTRRENRFTAKKVIDKVKDKDGHEREITRQGVILGPSERNVFEIAMNHRFNEFPGETLEYRDDNCDQSTIRRNGIDRSLGKVIHGQQKRYIPHLYNPGMVIAGSLGLVTDLLSGSYGIKSGTHTLKYREAGGDPADLQGSEYLRGLETAAKRGAGSRAIRRAMKNSYFDISDLPPATAAVVKEIGAVNATIKNRDGVYTRLSVLNSTYDQFATTSFTQTEDMAEMLIHLSERNKVRIEPRRDAVDQVYITIMDQHALDGGTEWEQSTKVIEASAAQLSLIVMQLEQNVKNYYTMALSAPGNKERLNAQLEKKQMMINDNLGILVEGITDLDPTIKVI